MRRQGFMYIFITLFLLFVYWGGCSEYELLFSGSVKSIVGGFQKRSQHKNIVILIRFRRQQIKQARMILYFDIRAFSKRKYNAQDIYVMLTDVSCYSYKF